MSGWIKLHRSIVDHWLYTEKRTFSKFEAWNDILLMVNFTDAKAIIKGKLYDVKRGQSIMSLDSWGKRWNWDKSRVRRFMNSLQKDNMIVLQGDNITTRLTVCKYETYQGERHTNDTQTTHKRTSNEHQTTPIEEGKESKEEKEEKYIPYDFKKSCIDYGFDKVLVRDWMIVRKKASNTETAFKSFVKQVEKSGLDKNFVLQECVYRNWISFKASWKIEQPQQQKTDSTQPIGTNKKPFTKLRRKDFKSNSEFLGACHKRQENPDPFDFSFPKDLTKDKTDEQIEYMESELMRDNPNGLRIEL